MVCCFDLKKSRNDWRISELVIIESANLRERIAKVKNGMGGAGRGGAKLFLLLFGAGADVLV